MPPMLRLLTLALAAGPLLPPAFAEEAAAEERVVLVPMLLNGDFLEPQAPDIVPGAVPCRSSTAIRGTCC